MQDMKQNRVLWRLLNDEEKAVLEAAGPENCELFGLISKAWLVNTHPDVFNDDNIYRVKSDYKPKCKTCNDTKQVGEEESYQGRSVGWRECPDCIEPEVERCEVFERDFCLRYKRGSTMVSLLIAPNEPDFMYYEYEKGSKTSMPRLTCDNKPAKVPKFVVFRRNACEV